MTERRVSTRARLMGRSLWLNKHVDGFPYLAEVVEVSENGMLLRTIREPSNPQRTFTLEFEIPGSSHRMWLWAELVRSSGSLQAVRIHHADLLERAQLRQLVRWNAAAA
jgi:endonuclease/exonuclease/phosphatase family metal-dependent hydrolase